MSNGHSAVREGAIAGAIGAAILAGWYFVVDVAHGQPFRTPLLIAQLLFGGVGGDGLLAGQRREHEPGGKGTGQVLPVRHDLPSYVFSSL